MLYREIVYLRKKDKLSEKNLEIVYDSLIEEYDKFQDRYDKETDHSTIGSKQKEWESKIRIELDRLSGYADYTEF